MSLNNLDKLFKSNYKTSLHDMRIKMNNNLLFKKKFAELEEFIKKYYGFPDVYNMHKMLVELKQYNDAKSKLIINRTQNFKQIRNLLSHSSLDLIIVTEHTLKELSDFVNEIKSDKTASDICIKEDQLYTTNFDACALDVMHTMVKKVYTNVPIINTEGYLEGVFSEYSIFAYFASKAEHIIETKYLRIKDFKDFTNISSCRKECCYEFVNENLSIIELKSKFHECVNNGKRLSCIFITENGKAKEKVKGIITAWDLAGL